MDIHKKLTEFMNKNKGTLKENIKKIENKKVCGIPKYWKKTLHQTNTKITHAMIKVGGKIANTKKVKP